MEIHKEQVIKQKQSLALQMRLQAKVEQERRAQSRLESLKEGALEVKEQRGVILDLKHQLKQQEI